MNCWGIGLPTELPFRDGDLADILALGVDHYLAYLRADQVVEWTPILEETRRRQPGAQLHLRIEQRGQLDANADYAILSTVYLRFADLITTLRIRNEPNLESDCTPQQWGDYLIALGTLLLGWPDLREVVYVPALSPGESRYREFLFQVRRAQIHQVFAGFDVHAYGDPAETLAVIDDPMVESLYPQLVTEYNFGAGREYDLDWYAANIPVVFNELTERKIPGMIFVARWVHPPPSLPTTVDVLGVPIVYNAIRDAHKESPVPDSKTELQRSITDLWKRNGADYVVPQAFSDYWTAQLNAGRMLGTPSGGTIDTDDGVWRYQWFQSTVLHAKIGEWIVREGLPPPFLA